MVTLTKRRFLGGCVKEITSTGNPCWVWWYIHFIYIFESSVISTVFLYIIVMMVLSVVTLLSHYMNIACLSWWTEAVNLLWNWLSSWVSRLAWFNGIALSTNRWLILLLVLLNIVAACFINWIEGISWIHLINTPYLGDCLATKMTLWSFNWWLLIQLAWGCIRNHFSIIELE